MLLTRPCSHTSSFCPFPPLQPARLPLLGSPQPVFMGLSGIDVCKLHVPVEPPSPALTKLPVEPLGAEHDANTCKRPHPALDPRHPRKPSDQLRKSLASEKPRVHSDMLRTWPRRSRHRSRLSGARRVLFLRIELHPFPMLNAQCKKFCSHTSLALIFSSEEASTCRESAMAAGSPTNQPVRSLPDLNGLAP